MKKAHRIVSLAIAVFLVLLAGTGVVLNHPGLVAGRAVEQPLSLAGDPRSPRTLLRGTTLGLYRSVDGGARWREVRTAYELSDVVDLVFAPAGGTVFALSSQWGLFRSRDAGLVWEPVRLPFDPSERRVVPRRVVPGAGERLAVFTSDGLLESRDGGKAWSWTWRRARPDIRHVVHDLHTGYLFGREFVYVYDAAALGVFISILTGYVIWRREQGVVRG